MSLMPKNIESLDHLLVICPDSYKRAILLNLFHEKKILDIQFMTLNEYKRNYFFDYDVKTIRYLMEQYSLSVSNSKEVLENLIFVDGEIVYHNEKLDQLVLYKKDLEKHNLLIYNDLFKKHIQTRNVVVLGLSPLSCFDKECIKGKTVTILEENKIDKEYVINEFDDIEEEVEFIYNSIFDLLQDGKNINDIYVMNVSNEYESYIKRYNTFFDFEIDYPTSDKLIGINVVSDLIALLDNSKEEVMEYLNTIQDISIYKQIVSILNKYTDFEYKQVKDLIIDDLKNTSITKKQKKNVVRCIDILDVTKDTDSIFLIGFNDTCIPTKMDTDYITDNIASLVNKPISMEENINTKKRYEIAISKIKNCTISYSKSSSFNNHDISNLFEKYTLVSPKTSYDYSEKLNRMKYGFALDKLLKYNDQDKEVMGYLYNNYHKNDYLSYSNKFNQLSKTQIEELKKVTLSYSSMDNYSKCSFKYFLSNILKLDNNESTFYSRYGTLCHNVLKNLYANHEFSFDEVFNNEINAYENNNHQSICENKMEEFFLDIIKEELRQDVEILRKQKENSLFDEFYCENEFKVELGSDLYFKGFIDKLMVKQKDDCAYVSIVDYKTGEGTKYDPKLGKYGLTLQLPVYMWLLLKSGKIDKDIKFVGIYLQHLINTKRNYTQDKTIADLKNDSILLEGISANDKERLMILDLSLDQGKSDVIKSVTVKKEGDLKANNNIVSDDTFTCYIENVEETAKNSFVRIQNGDFAINPKQIDGKNESCQYCSFANICYRKDRDLKIINTKEEQ